MDNLYNVVVNGFCEPRSGYMDVAFQVYAPGALQAVKSAFEIGDSFGLGDKRLVLLELVEEDVQ